MLNPYDVCKDFKPKLITTGKVVALWRMPYSAIVVTPGEHYGKEINGNGCELWQDYDETLTLKNDK